MNRSEWNVTEMKEINGCNRDERKSMEITEMK